MADRGMVTRGFLADPVEVEVITLMLTIQTEECKNCRLIFEDTDIKRKFADRKMNEYPEDVKKDVLHLSNWIRGLARDYSDRIQIKVTDALSLLGLYKSIRHQEIPHLHHR